MMILPFAACTAEKNPAGGDENGNENGNGGSGNGGQQSEIVCPTSVRAGSEGVIQWDGFVEGDVLCLAAKDGDDHQLEIKAITSSGLTFYVPKSVPAGNYMLVLKRDTRMELGQIEILPPSSPVSAVSVPSKVACGEVLEITGIGFVDGCALNLKNAEGDVYTFMAELTDLGVMINIPEDMPTGTYDVYLFQDGVEWLLGTALEVREAVSEEVVKEMSELRYMTPSDEGTMSMRKWTIDRGENITLEVAGYTIENGVETKGSYDVYISEDGYKFILTEDGMEVTNDIEMSYVLADDGSIQSSDVILYGKKAATPVTWTYENSLLVDVASEKGSFTSLDYDADGNLILFHATDFEYLDASLVNAANAPDAAWAYMAMLSGHRDPFIYIPFFLGWSKNPDPAQLPSAVYLPDPDDVTGQTEIAHPFSYEFDSDGYISKMSWTVEGGDHWIELIY